MLNVTDSQTQQSASRSLSKLSSLTGLVWVFGFNCLFCLFLQVPKFKTKNQNMIQKIQSVENFVLLKLLAQVCELTFQIKFESETIFFCLISVCSAYTRLGVTRLALSGNSYRFFLEIRGQCMMSIKQSALRAEVVTKFRFFNRFVKEVNILAITDMNCQRDHCPWLHLLVIQVSRSISSVLVRGKNRNSN